MACNKECGQNVTCSQSNNGGYLIILVLYILLAILLGSRLYY